MRPFPSHCTKSLIFYHLLFKIASLLRPHRHFNPLFLMWLWLIISTFYAKAFDYDHMPRVITGYECTTSDICCLDADKDAEALYQANGKTVWPLISDSAKVVDTYGALAEFRTNLEKYTDSRVLCDRKYSGWVVARDIQQESSLLSLLQIDHCRSYSVSQSHTTYYKGILCRSAGYQI